MSLGEQRAAEVRKAFARYRTDAKLGPVQIDAIPDDGTPWCREWSFVQREDGSTIAVGTVSGCGNKINIRPS